MIKNETKSTKFDGSDESTTRKGREIQRERLGRTLHRVDSQGEV